MVLIKVSVNNIPSSKTGRVGTTRKEKASKRRKEHKEQLIFRLSILFSADYFLAVSTQPSPTNYLWLRGSKCTPFYDPIILGLVAQS